MTRNTKDPIRALPERTQPPLRISARLLIHTLPEGRRSPLPCHRRRTESGNRVEGLGNFGKPTGEFGTVKQANDGDAVVKWDDDGRHRVGQRWLKKV